MLNICPVLIKESKVTKTSAKNLAHDGNLYWSSEVFNSEIPVVGKS